MTVKVEKKILEDFCSVKSIGYDKQERGVDKAQAR